MSLKNKRIAFVSYHIHKNPGYRPSLIHGFFLKRQAEYKSYALLASDWDHMAKARQNKLEFVGQEIYWIHVPAYTKNISIMRVLSYFVFSLKLLFSKQLWQADVFFVSVPPSIAALVPAMIAFIKRKPWVVDIVDLWPEALPLSVGKKKFFMSTVGWVWVGLRNFFYSRARLFISHSQYFLKHTRTKNALWLPLVQTAEIESAPKGANSQTPLRAPIENEIRICVLGSINNVLNIDSLVEIATSIERASRSTNDPGDSRKLVLEILGGGERKKTLITELKMAAPSWQVVDHGISFDPELKKQILGRCHFGYNGYQSTTAIGITYKSIDFASFGNVLLNSLQGDLNKLIETYGAGFNFDIGDEAGLAKKILELNNADYAKMSEGAKRLAQETFSPENFESKLTEALEGV